jgi:pyrroline-5-carboxylate reductase
MGGAMIRGLLSTNTVKPGEIVVNEIDEARRAAVVREYGVVGATDVLDGVSGARAVVLAVKPQQFAGSAADIAAGLSDQTLVISIMAGVRIATIGNALAHTRVVRAMPNLPAQIGRGVVVWSAGASVSQDDLALAARLLGAVGVQVQVDAEKDIDAATAVHGSGPAYAYLVAEAWIDAAVGAGLARPLAEQLVRETMAGSIALWGESGKSPAELRHAVTSPGGTTAAALQALEEHKVRAAFGAAIQAALHRSRELG